jgi:carbon storage regulator
MLVLTRNEGQAIRIGDDVKLTVVSTKGGQVRIGIEAPRDLTILRAELVDRDGEAQSSPYSTPPDQET